MNNITKKFRDCIFLPMCCVANDFSRLLSCLFDGKATKTDFKKQKAPNEQCRCGLSAHFTMVLSNIDLVGFTEITRPIQTSA